MIGIAVVVVTRQQTAACTHRDRALGTRAPDAAPTGWRRCAPGAPAVARPSPSARRILPTSPLSSAAPDQHPTILLLLPISYLRLAESRRMESYITSQVTHVKKTCPTMPCPAFINSRLTGVKPECVMCACNFTGSTGTI